MEKRTLIVVAAMCFAMQWPTANGAVVDVTISNFAFSPKTVTIKPGDTIRWTNQDPFNHTSTSGSSCSPSGIWDSPLLSQGNSFSFQFNSAGTFPYFCRPHCSSMSGTVIVQSANTPPSVSITSPTNGTVLSNGADITITATAADVDGTVVRVQFLDGATSLANLTTPPYTITTTLSAGSHNLTARATDNGGAVGQSSVVTVSVNSVPITDPIPDRIPKGDITVELQTVLDGQVSPLGLAVPDDGSGRFFVFDQSGVLWVVGAGGRSPAPLLDLSSRLASLGAYDERGLLGVAAHPDFAHKPFIYTFSSETNGPTTDFSSMLPDGITNSCQSVLAEWRISATNANQIDPASRRELLRIDKPEFNHNGGSIHFGADGFLYLGAGDGGAANDVGDGHMPGGNAQDLSMALGKLLRIDVDGNNSANGHYGIPASNPFIGNGLPEIFAYGFRNPYNWSFDRATGQIWVGDVGQNNVEEIDQVVSGGNFGWNIKEGTFWFDSSTGNDVTSPIRTVPANLVEPVAEYGHHDGSAIIGGYVYRGSGIPELTGHYVFGDWGAFTIPSGRLFYLDGSTIRELKIGVEDRPLNLWVKGFGEGPDGELYVFGSRILGPAGNTGKMLKLVSAPSPLYIASTKTDGTNLLGGWVGGTGPFIVQGKHSLSDGGWQALEVTTNRTAKIPLTDKARFARIFDAAHLSMVPFTASLSGALAHPGPVATGASASGTFGLDGSGLSFNIIYSGLTQPPTAAWIQNETDGLVLDISSNLIDAAATSGAISGVVLLSDSQKAVLLSGRAFVTLATGNHPSGELRGPMAALLLQTDLTPAPSSKATGWGLLGLAKNQISFNLVYSNLSSALSSVELHWPAPQSNAVSLRLDITGLNVPVSTTAGAVTGTLPLPVDALASVASGSAWIEIHTLNAQAAELSGGIASQPSGTPVGVSLSGIAEPTPVTTDAAGSGLFSLEGRALRFVIRYTGLSGSPTATGLYAASGPGNPATLAFDLSSYYQGVPGTNGVLDGTLPLTQAQYDAILYGLAYINISTQANPDGEVLGTLSPVLMRASLAGSQIQFSPVTTKASGFALLTLLGNQLTVDLTSSGLNTPATRIEWHGPASLFGTGSLESDWTGLAIANTPTVLAASGNLSLTPGQRVDLINKQTYLQIITPAHPGGEIRGQVGY